MTQNTKTDWHPHKTKPVHKGVYQVKAKFPEGSKQVFWNYWDGHRWCGASTSLAQAREWGANGACQALQDREWRGLTDEGRSHANAEFDVQLTND
jgi:hypothetical protein